MIGKSGKIITFYSYKGGTGRTMALSNVAWILASNGSDVLLVDWDLEAPGLHRYLRPFLIDPELKSSVGVIDFVWDAARVNVTPLDKSAEFPSLEDYIVGLDWDFGDSGSISIIPAGRQDKYAQRVNTFTWDNFYERLGGGKLLQSEFENLRKTYDYILIDSRTGVSDTSGICTVQLPDKLAVFFTLNWQSIKGAAAVASSVRAQRGEKLQIFPVPTRLENGEQKKLKIATDFARGMFAPFLLHMNIDERTDYWHEVETPYISYYAFEEVPAAFMEERGSQRGILAPTERLAAHLSGQRDLVLKPAPDELRKRVVAAFEFTEEQVHKVAWDAAREPSGTALTRLTRLFGSWRWQLATAAAGVASIIFITLWAVDARRVADLSTRVGALSTQLSMSSFQMDEVRSHVNEMVKILQDPSNPNTLRKLADADGTRLYAIVKEIEKSLNTLKQTEQGLPRTLQPVPQPQKR